MLILKKYVLPGWKLYSAASWTEVVDPGPLPENVVGPGQLPENVMDPGLEKPKTLLTPGSTTCLDTGVKNLGQFQ